MPGMAACGSWGLVRIVKRTQGRGPSGAVCRALLMCARSRSLSITPTTPLPSRPGPLGLRGKYQVIGFIQSCLGIVPELGF